MAVGVGAGVGVGMESWLSNLLARNESSVMQQEQSDTITVTRDNQYYDVLIHDTILPDNPRPFSPRRFILTDPSKEIHNPQNPSTTAQRAVEI